MGPKSSVVRGPKRRLAWLQQFTRMSKEKGVAQMLPRAAQISVRISYSQQKSSEHHAIGCSVMHVSSLMNDAWTTAVWRMRGAYTALPGQIKVAPMRARNIWIRGFGLSFSFLAGRGCQGPGELIGFPHFPQLDHAPPLRPTTAHSLSTVCSPSPFPEMLQSSPILHRPLGSPWPQVRR